MTRFPAIPTLLSLAAFVAVAACSPKADTAADTTAAVTDTAVVAPAATSTSTPAATDTSGAAIVPVNINTATDAEILRIPGVGPRMLREFKEYRPYKDISQFNREIGKYVSPEEVVRLRSYVTLP